MINEFGYIYFIHSGGNGALVAPLYKWFELIDFCLSDDFNTAIMQIFNRAQNGKLFRFLLGKFTEINALDAARDRNFNGADHLVILQQ